MRRSPWRSPLLVLGIAVILVAAVAIVAPLFITWSAWRGDIEAFASRLAGRDVRIEGPIDAALFPWPRLTLGGVTVAGAPGGGAPWLLRAPRIDIALALPPLLSGEIEIAEIAVFGPDVQLERLPGGGWSAALTPVGPLPASLDPARVSLPRIVVKGGTLTLADAASGGRFAVGVLDATASAPALSGPWRSTTRLDVGGDVRVLALATGAWRTGEPLRLYATLGPEPGQPGYAMSFDGAVPLGGAPATGSLKLQPVAAADGRADPQFGFQPMALKADVEIAGAAVLFPKIEIAPAAAGDAGNIIAGTGNISIGERIAVSARLASPRLDLDRLIGLEKRQAIASAGAIGLLADWASRLPPSVDADVRLAVAALDAGGETLDGAVVDVAAGRQGVRLNEFAVSLPGQTRVRLEGRVSGVSPNATLDGRIKLASGFLRDFIAWVSPSEAERLAAVWSGARGAFALDGALSAGPGTFAVSDAVVTLDETKGELALGYTANPRPALDITLEADTLDPARYAPAARAVTPAQLVSGLSGLAGSGADVAVTMRLDRLVLNAEAARGVELDLRAAPGGVDLRAFALADVGGGRLNASGEMTLADGRAAGTVQFDAAAGDPRALARFAGLASPASSRGAWTAGPLLLSGRAEAQPDGDTATAVTVSGRASLGLATAALDGRFAGALDDWRNGSVDARVEAASPTSGALAALLGLNVAGDAGGPAKVKARAKGTPSGGLDLSLDAEGFGAAGQFQGTVTAAQGWQAQGRAALLAPDASPLLAALGLAAPPPGSSARFVSGEARIEATPERIALSNLAATIAGTSVKGHVSAGAAAPFDIAGTLDAATADAPAILGWLVPGDGPAALDRPFGDRARFDTVDLVLRARDLTLLAGVGLADATFTVRSGGGDLDVSISGRDETGAAATVSLDASPSGQGLAVRTRGTMALRLAERLRQAGGAPALAGTASVTFEAAGAGLSPASVIAGLEGKGTVALSALRLAGVDPAGFAGGLEAAQTATDVDRLVDSTLRAGSIAIADATVPLTVASGIASSAPVPVTGEDVEGTLRLILDLAAARADVSADLTLTGQGRSWPAFELAWSGPPGALEPAYDIAALKSAVGVEVLKRGVDRLEALQREQQRLAEEERAFARQQAIPYTEELTRRYLRARAGEARAARDAVETRRQSAATAFRKAAEEARRAEEEARRKAEEEARKQLAPPAPDGALEPLPSAPPEAAPAPPTPRAKPALPQPAPQPAVPAPVGTPSVVPPIPGEGDLTIEMQPLPPLSPPGDSPSQPSPSQEGTPSPVTPAMGRERK